MTDIYTAARQALEALEVALEIMKDDWQAIDNEFGPSPGGLDAAISGQLTGYSYFQKAVNSIAALREALEQPAQEPVAWGIIASNVGLRTRHRGRTQGEEHMSKPEALRLADALDDSSLTVHHKAATELRRLHGVNQDLLEALKELLDREWQDDEGDFTLEMARKKARAAIAKATGETK